MNAPYPPVIIESEGKLYPYLDETLAKIAIIENNRMGFPASAVWKLEADGYGYAYRTVDAIEFVKPVEVETPTQELTLVA